jgi:hypothetical protein
VERDARDRLKEQIEECDAVIRDEGNSADPVARRRVTEALRAKAMALGELGRYEGRVAVWDALIARHAEGPADSDPLFLDRIRINKAMDLRRTGRDQEAIDSLADVRRRHAGPAHDPQSRLVSVHALALTRDALTSLRRYEDASALDDEIIRRFADASEPELHRRVAYALAHRTYVRLREGRIQDALDDGDALLARFEAETDPDVRRRIGEVMLDHVQTLLRTGSAGPRWIAGSIGLILIGALCEGGLHLCKRLRIAPALAPRDQRVGRVLNSPPGMASVIDKRRRMKQALAVSRALVDRFGSAEEPDLRQLVARARIFEAAALGLLGRLREAGRVFDVLTKSGDEAVAEAFRTFAIAVKSEGGVRGEFGSVSHLFHRAATLGQGDPRMTRIAYEESTSPGTPGSPSTRAGALMARLLTPGKRQSHPRR